MQSGIITVDLHNMNAYQARIKLQSTLKRADASVYRIVVVHGYHGGSTLRNMVQNEFLNHPKVKRIAPLTNAGETVLVLRD